MAKKFEIRNSTAEFLIFQLEGKESGVQVVYKDETIWATQKAMAELFDCSVDNIGLHLKNIFKTGELDKDSVTEKISATESDGILEAGGDAVLEDSGKVSAEYAKEFAESEFEKYRIVQDRLFKSDFDKFNDEGLLPLDE